MDQPARRVAYGSLNSECRCLKLVDTFRFFQIVRATVAIFRARVSRAISDRSPFCWRLFRYSDQGSLRPPATAAEMKTDFSRRLQFRFNPRVATGLDRRSTRPARNSYSALVCVTGQAAIAPELPLGSVNKCVNRHQAAFSSVTWLTGTPLTYWAPW